MRTSIRIAIVAIGLPIAIVLFGIIMLVGLLVFGVPILLLTLLAATSAGIVGFFAGLIAFIYYFAREEKHARDPGNYSLDQTKSADEK